MTFLVFEVISQPKSHLRSTSAGFQLAGRNLLFRAWERRHRPIAHMGAAATGNTGWDVSADELIRDMTDGLESYATRRLVIDLDPTSPTKVSLMELLHVYAITYGGNDIAEWTPLMLKMRDLYYDEDCESLDFAKRSVLYNHIEIPAETPPIIEFLICMERIKDGASVGMV